MHSVVENQWQTEPLTTKAEKAAKALIYTASMGRIGSNLQYNDNKEYI